MQKLFSYVLEIHEKNPIYLFILSLSHSDAGALTHLTLINGL